MYKNPLPTDAQTVIDAVTVKIRTDWPTGDTFFDGLPQPDCIARAYNYVGATLDEIVARYATALGYYGFPSADFAMNARIRTNAFAVGHDLVGTLVERSFALGIPLQPKSDFIVTPLVASFSETEIQRRLTLTPPLRYDGAPCYADPKIWEPIAFSDLVKVMANPVWDVVPVATKQALATSLWLSEYKPSNLNPNDIVAFTAAQVFRKYDQATLPGLPATD
jgi:hypothetical protein